MAKQTLLIVSSYHHKNTEKIAVVMAAILDAELKTPQQINPMDLQEYSLIGFGSGIYSDTHHPAMLALADKLPQAGGQKAFLFSTFGVPASFVTETLLEEFTKKNHTVLREKLQAKGYLILDEFSCVGFNTNSFLKFFGGINKGRPNADDIKRAEAFARGVKQKLF